MTKLNDKIDVTYLEDLMMQQEDVIDSLSVLASYTDEKSQFSEIHGMIEVLKRDSLNFSSKLAKLLIEDSNN